MIVPFRECALRIVHIFISLLEVNDKKKIDVSNKKRFKGEFGSDPEEKPPNLKRPEDYEAVFAGNIDDHFRVGNNLLKKRFLACTELLSNKFSQMSKSCQGWKFWWYSRLCGVPAGFALATWIFLKIFLALTELKKEEKTER